MKITEETIKKMIQEEIQKVISEQGDTNAMIDSAQATIEQEAKAAFDKIKSSAEKAGMSVDVLKGLFVQFIQNMK
jgi:delta 1-pyrroline-5-carboxylate dehydrogenase